MIPFARFAFIWDDAGGKYYNVVDGESRVYANGSTLSEKTVKSLGLPVVENAEDEENLIRQVNAAYLHLRGE